jgi:hypothetical protein
MGMIEQRATDIIHQYVALLAEDGKVAEERAVKVMATGATDSASGVHHRAAVTAAACPHRRGTQSCCTGEEGGPRVASDGGGAAAGTPGIEGAGRQGGRSGGRGSCEGRQWGRGWRKVRALLVCWGVG